MAEVTYEGLTFTIPSDVKKLPVKAVDAWEQEQVVGFIKALVKPQEWALYMSRDPNMEEFQGLAKAIGKHYGFEGESSASRDSSVSTAGPSKPTSNTPTVSPSAPATPIHQQVP